MPRESAQFAGNLEQQHKPNQFFGLQQQKLLKYAVLMNKLYPEKVGLAILKSYCVVQLKVLPN